MQAETYTEDTPLNLTDIVVTDVDSANVTVTLNFIRHCRRKPEHRYLRSSDLNLCRRRMDSQWRHR